MDGVTINEKIYYHYAVKKTGPFLEPACVKDRFEVRKLDQALQGMTVNRGKVVCPECLLMMGSPISWEKLVDVLGDGAFVIFHPKVWE